MLIAFLVVLLLILLWLFCALPQLPTRSLHDFEGWDYAHRGLWNKEVPENSLTAFRRAADAGFGIELDVQRSSDGQLVVFHDDDLARMCGVRKPVCACSLTELRGLRLAESDETIPTFTEVLDAVGGRVPIIVEIKQGAHREDTCRKTDALLQRYPGLTCVESFDPRVVRWFRKNRPQRIRGQLTAWPGRRSVCRRNAKTVFLGLMLANVIGRPDFIAHETATDSSIFFRIARRLGAHTVAWTVKSQEEMDALRSRYELLIFDSFVPERRA